MAKPGHWTRCGSGSLWPESRDSPLGHERVRRANLNEIDTYPNRPLPKHEHTYTGKKQTPKIPTTPVSTLCTGKHPHSPSAPKPPTESTRKRTHIEQILQTVCKSEAVSEIKSKLDLATRARRAAEYQILRRDWRSARIAVTEAKRSAWRKR